MGNSFWILVWDGWGCGLDMINARLHAVYDPVKMITRNSFAYLSEADIKKQLVDMEIDKKYGTRYKIIRSGL